MVAHPASFPAPKMAPCPSFGSRPSHGVPLPCVPSLACGTLPFSPACRPLFSPRDWPPVPESQGTAPARVSQAVVSGPVFQIICAALTLLCCYESSCCAFLGDVEVPLTGLIFRQLGGFPGWVPFLLHSSPSEMLVLSWFLLSLFFSFCSTQFCQEFLALFGGSSPSASISWCSVRVVLHGDVVLWCVCGEGEHDLLLLCRLVPPPQEDFLEYDSKHRNHNNNWWPGFHKNESLNKKKWHCEEQNDRTQISIKYSENSKGFVSKIYNLLS